MRTHSATASSVEKARGIRGPKNFIVYQAAGPEITHCPISSGNMDDGAKGEIAVAEKHLVIANAGDAPLVRRGDIQIHAILDLVRKAVRQEMDSTGGPEAFRRGGHRAGEDENECR